MMNNKPAFISNSSAKEISLYPQTNAPISNLVNDSIFRLNKGVRSLEAIHCEPLQTASAEKPSAKIFSLQPTNYTSFVGRVKEMIQTNIDDENYGIEQLCKDIGASRSVLHRKLKKYTMMSTSKFVRVIRLKKAKELLLNTDLNITQVSFEVGFADSRYFSRVFSETFNESPKHFRCRSTS